MQGFGAGLGYSDNMNNLMVLWTSHGLRKKRKNLKPFGIVPKILPRLRR